MGRSGRRGKAANVTWILKGPCELLCSAAIIECAMEREVEDLAPLRSPFSVLVQQLFLLLHRRARMSRQELRQELLSYPAFGSLDPRDIDRIISHLTAEGYLTADGEMLMPGTEAERIFGRSNWKDLYSVISGGGEYRAVTPDGEVIGNLDARFVSSREGGEVSLGGRSWSMVKSDEGHNIVVIVPGGSGSARTFWTGTSAEGYSPLVCHKVRQIVCRGGSVLPLSAPEKELLSQVGARFPPHLPGSGLFVMEQKGHRGFEVVIWSFGGSRFNRVLSLILSKKLGSRSLVRYNDFVVTVQRAGKERAAERVREVLRAITSMERSRIAAALPLPSVEEWKFARVLPRPVFAELVAADYYHIDEFMNVLQGLAVLPDDVAPS